MCLSGVRRAHREPTTNAREPAMSAEASWSELLAGRNAARAAMLASGVVVHAINVFLATTILPSIVADIGGLDYYAWNTTLFVLASIAGAASSPRLLQST